MARNLCVLAGVIEGRTLRSNQILESGVMVNPEIVIVPAVFSLTSVVLIVRMWLRHREKMAGLGAGVARGSDVEGRLERIEQAVDAIAIEMERIGEGQRFVTKLLAERPALRADAQSAARERVITPH